MSIIGQIVTALPDNSLYAPSEILNGDSRILFGPDSVDDKSAVFVVLNRPYTIRAFNLISGESVSIEMVAGPGSGTMFAQAVTPEGNPVVLTPGRPSYTLFIAGRYRARLNGRVGEVYVDTFPTDLLRTSGYSTNYGT